VSNLLTPAQQQFLKLVEEFETIKKRIKEIKPELDQALTQIGIGSYFQNPEDNTVYKVTAPEGRFVYFDKISYDRTKKEDEKRGSLSKKEAQEQGFEL